MIKVTVNDILLDTTDEPNKIHGQSICVDWEENGSFQHVLTLSVWDTKYRDMISTVVIPEVNAGTISMVFNKGTTFQVLQQGELSSISNWANLRLVPIEKK